MRRILLFACVLVIVAGAIVGGFGIWQSESFFIGIVLSASGAIGGPVLDRRLFHSPEDCVKSPSSLSASRIH